MTNGERSGDPSDFNLADIIGDSYPSPIELSESLSEHELRDAIHAKSAELLDIQVEMANLQSRWQKTANERLLYSDAYRIARDKGLE